MAQELSTALKTAKQVERELTVSENRMEYVKSETERLTTARDALQAEIQQKSADYASYMANKDAEIKKMRSDVLADREQLQKEKAEFMTILKQHQADKAGLDAQKSEFEVQKLRHTGSVQNVQEFITAVRRASSLLGF